MITVSFLPQQGLGNQLWLLFATYSLSKHLNITFRIYNSHHFKGWKLLSRNFVEKISCINALEQSVEHTFLQPSLFCSQSGNLYFPDTPESYNFQKYLKVLWSRISHNQRHYLNLVLRQQVIFLVLTNLYNYLQYLYPQY